MPPPNIQMYLLASLSIVSRRGPHVRGKIGMRKAVDGARLCQIGLGCADHVGVGVGVVTRAYARVDGQVGGQKEGDIWGWGGCGDFGLWSGNFPGNEIICKSQRRIQEDERRPGRRSSSGFPQLAPTME